jgi:two-component system chemotaxis response regulator CheY
LSKSILIVEDDPQVRNLIKLVLAGEGFDLVEAEDGARGLSQILRNRGRFAAVLTDIDMGRMNGIEFAESVKEHYPAVPILFISALPVGPEELQRAAPGSTFIRKPFDSTALIQTVRTMVGKS